MKSGEVLEVILDDGEPIKNVPRSVEAEGHEIINIERLEDGSSRLIVKKA
jgi:tRNA 2-thiouridine synthesizing protein A